MGKILTSLIATYAGRVTSLRSTSSFDLASQQKRTLLYQNIIPQDDAFYGFGGVLEPRYIVGPEPLDQ